MTGCYPVRCGCDTVGKLQIEKVGLYYRFVCRCRQNSDSVYRLVAQYETNRIPLGVLVPEGLGTGLDRKLPVKQFPEGEPTFLIVPVHPQLQGLFIPLSPEEPFAYLSRLKDAFLTEQNGVTGIFLPNKI